MQFFHMRIKTAPNDYLSYFKTFCYITVMLFSPFFCIFFNNLKTMTALLINAKQFHSEQGLSVISFF